MRFVRLLDYRRKTERSSLLPMYSQERALPRKALSSRGSINRANHFLSSKSFFVEPRHRESFGGVRYRTGKSKRKRTSRSWRFERTVSERRNKVSKTPR